MTEEFQPADEMVISDLETLKVLSDPLRLRLIEVLMSEPMTVKVLAEHIDIPATKLYYHINLLDKHGLIRVVKTQVVSGIIEKTYWVTAGSFRIDRSLLAFDTQSEDQMPIVDMVVTPVREEIRRGVNAGLISTEAGAPDHDRLLMSRTRVVLSPEQADAFYARVNELLQEFKELGSGEDPADGKLYTLTIVLYPGKLTEPPKEESSDE